MLSKLTPGAAEPPTRLEGVLPMGPRSATNDGPPYLSLVPYPEACYRLSLGVCWTCLLPGCPPHHWRWVAVPRSGLTAWYVYRET
jgi:hypothetical protein